MSQDPSISSVFVSGRGRVLNTLVVLAVFAATAPGAMALATGWGLNYKLPFIFAVVLAGVAAQCVALRLGLAHHRSIRARCPNWLRSPLGTAALVGYVVMLMSAGILALFGPYDLIGPIIGGVAAIAYLAWSVRQPEANN